MGGTRLLGAGNPLCSAVERGIARGGVGRPSLLPAHRCCTRCSVPALSQVYGVPDERMGEELAAAIRLKEPSQTLTLDDMKVFLKGKVRYLCRVYRSCGK